MMNKKNNKGFSLVELIVVVAIMAVLVGILAPAYLKYVENSRISKDETNAEEFRHAVEIAITEEDVYEDLSFHATNNNIVIKLVDETTIAVDPTANTTLIDEITETLGDELNFTSKKYNGKTYTITIDSEVKVTGAFN